jgi:hypothetical protein
MVDSASFDDAISSSNDKEKRRLRKQLRQAKKLAKQLESLGLDENGNDVDQNFALSDYPVREWTFTFPGMPHETVALNPLVSLIGIVCLWGLVVWYTGTSLLACSRRRFIMFESPCSD